LYFAPEPQGQGAFRGIFLLTTGCVGAGVQNELAAGGVVGVEGAAGVQNELWAPSEMLSPRKGDSRLGGTVEGAMQISENKGPDLAAPSSMVRGPQAHWDKAEALTPRGGERHGSLV
jgi:hypothetical protein